MTQTRWLSADEQRVWRQFAAVTTLLPAALDTQLQRDAELTHFGYWVLAMLSETPGHAVRMSDLAALAHGSQSRLSHLIARLERNGWVRRERASEDGRGHLAVLTDEGHAKIVASAPGHVARVRSLIFDALSPAQLAHLDEICAVILTRLDPRPSIKE
jgi:DNA-binding MarR family transcriptional regulator